MSTVTPAVSLQQELVGVVERLAADVCRRCPGVRFSLQQGDNSTFPWWIVGRMTNSGKLLDVSIDCRMATAGLTIAVDVAREDGAILAELPPLLVKPEAEQATIHAIDQFLSEQVGRVSAELT